MSNSRTLYRCPLEPLRPIISFQALLRREAEELGTGGRKHAWLAAILEDRPIGPDLSPWDAKTEIWISDVNSDGRIVNPRSMAGQFGPLGSRPSEWLQTPRQPDDCLRLAYVGIESEALFDTKIIDAIAMEYNLEPEFFFDHFLPSLWSDTRITFENESLSWIPPVLSKHKFYRLKDWREEYFSCFWPTEAKVQPRERYMSTLWALNNDPRRIPMPTMYNGSEYCFPVFHLLNKEYLSFLHGLELQILDENNIAAHRSRIVATAERLNYCLHNLTILGDHQNPETAYIETDMRYLIGFANKLKEDADDWVEKETRMGNKKAANENLQVAIEARDEARASRELGENVWRLTLLAFIFIPLNFMTSAFAMHLRLLGFLEDDGALPTWSFFTVAVPFELLVLFMFGIMSGYVVKIWKGSKHVIREFWEKLRRGPGKKAVLGAATKELLTPAGEA